MEASTSFGAQDVTILERTYPLADAWDHGDDWTGITGTKERKKRQNRINQRAYRESLWRLTHDVLTGCNWLTPLRS